MIELYHNSISVCAQKVRVTLAEKGLAWTGHHLDLVKGEHLTPQYLRINPKAVVPTLVHDGKVIIESTVIDEYLDDAFPAPPLKPTDAFGRYRMRLWSKLCDEGVHMACGSISFAAIFARQLANGHSPEALEKRLERMPDPARRERQRQIIQHGFDAPFVRDHVRLYDKALAEMEAALADRPWLAGAAFSLADISLIPYVERVDRLGLAGLWHPQRPRVADWFRRMKERPSFKSAIAAFDPVDYDDRVTESESAWPKVHAILAAA